MPVGNKAADVVNSKVAVLLTPGVFCAWLHNNAPDSRPGTNAGVTALPGPSISTLAGSHVETLAVDNGLTLGGDMVLTTKLMASPGFNPVPALSPINNVSLPPNHVAVPIAPGGEKNTGGGVSTAVCDPKKKL